MTIVERNNKLKHFIACLKCEVSGKCCDDNCPIQYLAGNMGEIIENLEAISKALEQEPKTGHWIRITNGAMKEKYICSECGRQIENDGIESLLPIKYPYCHCGAKMVEPQERSEDDNN